MPPKTRPEPGLSRETNDSSTVPSVCPLAKRMLTVESLVMVPMLKRWSWMSRLSSNV